MNIIGRISETNNSLNEYFFVRKKKTKDDHEWIFEKYKPCIRNGEYVLKQLNYWLNQSLNEGILRDVLKDSIEKTFENHLIKNNVMTQIGIHCGKL